MIFVIIDKLTKMVYYKLVKVTSNALGLAEVIIDMDIYHDRISESIITD